MYDVDESKLRDKMLELLITEDVGNPLKPNKMGMAPHMLDHRFNFQEDIPDKLKNMGPLKNLLKK